MLLFICALFFWFSGPKRCDIISIPTYSWVQGGDSDLGGCSCCPCGGSVGWRIQYMSNQTSENLDRYSKWFFGKYCPLLCLDFIFHFHLGVMFMVRMLNIISVLLPKYKSYANGRQFHGCQVSVPKGPFAFGTRFPIMWWLVNLYPSPNVTPPEIRPYWGLINHCFPLIRPY